MRKIQAFPLSWTTAVRIHVRDSGAGTKRRRAAPHAVARSLIAVAPVVVQGDGVGTERTELRIGTDDRESGRHGKRPRLDAEDDRHAAGGFGLHFTTRPEVEPLLQRAGL